MALTNEEWSEVERFVTPPIVRKLKMMALRLSALDWTPITPDNLPKVGDEVLGFYSTGEMNVYASTGKEKPENWKPSIFTHFRPLNAPKPRDEPR